jgi:integrase
MKAIKPSDRKRGKRGEGRLYIRNGQGKEFKAGTPNVENGFYWIEYQKPSGRVDQVTGRPIKKKKCEKLIDADGHPIRSLKKALEARALFMAQFQAGDEVHRLKLQDALKKAEVIHAATLDKVNPPLTISDSWDKFIDHPKLDCGATMLYNYQGHWKQFTEWLSNNDPHTVYMREIGKEVALDYARHLNRRRVSSNTYNKHINFLKLIFDVLREEARIEVSPFIDIATKKLARAKVKAGARQKKRRELTLDELIEVVDGAEGDLQTLLMLGAYTGLRLGDCCTLLWSECMLDMGMVKRVPNKTQGEVIKIGIPPRLTHRLSETPKSKRKGYVLPTFAADYTYITDKGKNSHRTRITNRIQSHFEACGINTHAEGTGYKLEPHPVKKGKYIKVHTGKRAVVVAGFHSLRHTFVSMQAERGIPQSVVQKIVGHGSPAMTAHYTHISDQAAQDATLFIGEGIQNAEFEVINEPLPAWAKSLAEQLNSKNWKQIKSELLSKK